MNSYICMHIYVFMYIYVHVYRNIYMTWTHASNPDASAIENKCPASPFSVPAWSCTRWWYLVEG